MFRFFRGLAKFFLGGLFGILLILFAGIFLFKSYMGEVLLKPKLEAAFSDFLTRKLTIESVKINFLPRLAIIGKNARLWEDEERVMAHSPKVEIRLNPRKIMEGRLVIESLIFHQPTGTLHISSKGKFPLGEMVENIIERIKSLKEKGGTGKGLKYKFGKIIIHDGIINFVDDVLKREPLQSTLFVRAEGEIRGKPGAWTFPFWLRAEVRHPGKTGDLRLLGNLKKYLVVGAHSRSFPIQFFSEHFPFLKNLEGGIPIQLFIQRRESGLHWTAKGESSKLRFSHIENSPSFNLKYELTAHQPSTFSVTIQDNEMNGSLVMVSHNFADRKITGTLVGSHVDIERVQDWFKRKGSLKKKELKQEGQQSSPKESLPEEVSSPTKKNNFWKFNIYSQIRDVVYKKIHLKSVDFHLNYETSGLVRLDPIKAKGDLGAIRGKATLGPGIPEGPFLTPQDSKARSFYVEWEAQNIKVESLAQSFIPGRRLSGTGETHGKISGLLDGKGWASTQGELFLEVRDGFLMGPGILKTFSSLNIRSLLSKDRGEKEEFHFEVVKAKFKIQNGKLMTEKPGVFENPTLQVAFMGSIDLVSQTIDSKLAIYFLTVAGEILKSVPGIKQILYRNQKSLVPVWVHLKGPLDDPDLKILKFESVARPIWQSIRNVLSFPFDALGGNLSD